MDKKLECITVTIDGKRKYFRGKTKEEAEEKKEKFLYDLEHPVITMQRVIDEWSEFHEPEVTYKTWLGYQTHIKGIETEFKGKEIKDVTHLDIARMLQGMAKKRYAARTVKTRMNVINMVMEFAVYEGYIDKNPCNLVRAPKGLKKGKRELPSDDEMNKAKNGLSCHFGLFAYFLLFTGLRRGEALAIKWEDINFQEGYINVYKSVYFKNNRPELKGTKTESGVRRVPLLTPLKTVLKDIKPQKGYLFGGETPMTEQALRRAWQRYCKESGVTITPHQLRHAFATMLFNAGIDAKMAQDFLGHSDYKTTVEIYTHISEKRKNQDTETLDKFASNF